MDPIRYLGPKYGYLLLERRAARRSQHRDSLDFAIAVPPGPEDRPGESVRAPSISDNIGFLRPSHSQREDFRVRVGPNSSVAAVCLGRPVDQGSPQESADRTILEFLASGAEVITAPARSSFAGCPAVAYSVRTRIGHELREMKLAKDGWLYAIGALLHPRDGRRAAELAAGVLDSWTWLGPDDPPQPPCALVGARTTRERVTASATVAAPIDDVWRLVYEPELAPLLEPRITRAYRTTGELVGVGERHVFLIDGPLGEEHIAGMVEVVEFEPPHHTVTRGLYRPDDERTSYDLVALGGQTVLTVTTTWTPELSSMRRPAVPRATEQLLKRARAAARSGIPPAG